ncbi:tetratricopeptide repeat protein [Maricaulaceae bacterium MS644]
MALFRRSFLTPCAVLAMSAAAAAPAGAGEVKDLLALPGGAVFVALDDTPASMTSSAGPGRVAVSFQGWSGRPRTLEPYGEAGFSRILVTADGFVLEGGFSGARAELRRGGVLIQFSDGARHDGEIAAGQGASRGGAPGSTSSYASMQANAHGSYDAQAGPADGPDANPGSAPSLAQSSDRAADPARQPDVEPEAASQDALSVPQRSSRSEPQREPAGYPGALEAAANAGEAASQPGPGPCDAQASALADAPWDLDRLTDHADCLVEAGETRNAAGLYERVLAFQPEHFRAALGLARLREQSGRYADAARLFETAAGSAMTDGEALAASAAARRAREAGQD